MSKTIYEAFLRGNEAGIEPLYLHYKDALIAYGRKFQVSTHILEDAVAETFKVLLEKIGSFNNENHIENFLYKTFKFQCINMTRKARKLIALPTDTHTEPDENPPTRLEMLEANVYRRLLLAEIAKKMERLPQKRREAFRSYFFEHKTFDEIAAHQSVTPGNIRRNVRNAILTIRKHLKNKGFTHIPPFLSLFLLVFFLN